jgi:hypothetical protein
MLLRFFLQAATAGLEWLQSTDNGRLASESSQSAENTQPLPKAEPQNSLIQNG